MIRTRAPHRCDHLLSKQRPLASRAPLQVLAAGGGLEPPWPGSPAASAFKAAPIVRFWQPAEIDAGPRAVFRRIARASFAPPQVCGIHPYQRHLVCPRLVCLPRVVGYGLATQSFATARKLWWRISESNRSRVACKASLRPSAFPVMWCRRLDSNQPPSALQADANPSQLQRHLSWLRRLGSNQHARD